MSNSLTWTNFDGTLFQRFCNMLLMHEISRHVVPFIAPGSDDGIDAMYEGEYEGLSGKWRFQAKFKSVATREAINKLRADIKSDIKKNLKEENILVFLTNVEIGPKQHKELVKTANDALAEIGRTEVSFLLWEHAKLEGLIGSHGVVYQYFWGNEKRFLIPWKESFSSKIEAPSSDPSGFGGGYYGRDGELDSLWNWLHDEPEQSYLSILAPGGWGKTRLAVEFFKRLDEANSEWSAWMPSSRTALKPENLGEAVNGSDKLVILIDDADLFGDMEDLINLLKTEDWKGRVKLLLTMRNSRLEYFYSGASPQFLLNRTTLLQKLAPHALYELCRELLDDSVEYEVIRKIVDASDGVPLIVRAMIAVANRGHLTIFQDKKLDFGKVVRKYLEEIYEHAISKSGEAVDLVKYVLAFSAIMSPFTLKKNGKFHRDSVPIGEGGLRRVMESFIESGIIQVVGSEMRPFYDENDIDLLIYDEANAEIRTTNLVDPQTYKSESKDLIFVPEDQYAVKPDPFSEYIIADSFQDTEEVVKLLEKENWISNGFMMVPNMWRAKAANKKMERMASIAFGKYVEQLEAGIVPSLRAYWDLLFRIRKKMKWQFHKGNLTVAKLVFEKLQQSDDIQDSDSITKELRTASFREGFSKEIKALFENGIVDDRTRGEYLEIADFVFAEIKHDSWFRTLCGLDQEQLAGKRDLKRQRDLLEWAIDGGIDRIENRVREFYLLPGQVYGWGGYHREKELSNSEQKLADEISALLSKMVQRLIDLYLEVGELESKRRLLISILMPILSNIDSKITQFTIRHGKKGNLSPYANRIIDFFEEVADQENEFEDRAMLAKILKNDTWGLEYIGQVDRVKDIYEKLIQGNNLSERVFFFRLMQRGFGSEFQVVRQKVKELFVGVGDKQIAQALSFLWKHQHQIYKTKAQFRWGELMNPISALEDYDPESLLNHLWVLDQEVAIRLAGDLLNDLRYRKKDEVDAFQGFVGRLLNDPTPARLDAILQAYNFGPEDAVFANLDAFDLEVFHQVGILVCKTEIPDYDDSPGFGYIDHPSEYHLHQSCLHSLKFLCRFHREEFREDLINYLKALDPQSALHLLEILGKEYIVQDFQDFKEIVFEHSPAINLFAPSSLWEHFLPPFYEQYGVNGIINLFEIKARLQKDKSPSFFHYGSGQLFRKDLYGNAVEQKVGSREIGDFWIVWHWFLQLDSESETIRIEEAWHLLKYFFEETFDPEMIAAQWNTDFKDSADDPQKLWKMWYASSVILPLKPPEDKKEIRLGIYSSLRAKITSFYGEEALAPVSEPLEGFSRANPASMDWAACFFMFYANMPFENSRLKTVMEEMRDRFYALLVFGGVDLGD